MLKATKTKVWYILAIIFAFLAGIVVGFKLHKVAPEIPIPAIRNLFTSTQEYHTYLPEIMSDSLPILGVQVDGNYPVEHLIVPFRVYHTMIRWTEAEIDPGIYVFPDWLDRMVEWFSPNPTIIDVKTVPEWARLWPDYQGSPPKEEYYDELGRFAAAVCARYGPWGVELFNEPDMGTRGGEMQDARGVDNPTQYYYGAWVDGSDFYSGGLLYGRMTAVVYPIIKAACPNTKVLAGALAGADNGLEFLRGAIDGGLTTDYVTFHYYIFKLDEVNRPFEYAKRIKAMGPWLLAVTETSFLQDENTVDLDSLKAEYATHLRNVVEESPVEFVLWYSMCSSWRNSWLAKSCVLEDDPGQAYRNWAEPFQSTGK